jgi:hypothetical protein
MRVPYQLLFLSSHLSLTLISKSIGCEVPIRSLTPPAEYVGPLAPDLVWLQLKEPHSTDNVKLGQ